MPGHVHHYSPSNLSVGNATWWETHKHTQRERDREITDSLEDLFGRKALRVFIEMWWLWQILAHTHRSILSVAHGLLVASAQTITVRTRRPRGRVCVCVCVWCSSTEETRSENHVQSFITFLKSCLHTAQKVFTARLNALHSPVNQITYLTQRPFMRLLSSQRVQIFKVDNSAVKSFLYVIFAHAGTSTPEPRPSFMTFGDS